MNNAQVHGIILDPSGAVVPGAAVEAISINTGAVQRTVSGSDGTYVLPGLQVGNYTLQVTAKGFNTVKQSGIVLEVGQDAQLNVSLHVGGTGEQVQVSADAPMVETQDTSISEVMDQQRIVDLPLNGRQATDLILLSGGAPMPPNAASRVVTTHDYVNSWAYPFPAVRLTATTTCWTAAITTIRTQTSICHSRFPMPCRNTVCRLMESRRATACILAW